MQIKELIFSPDSAILPDAVFEKIRGKYQTLLRHDRATGRRARQEELFSSIIAKARKIGVWDDIWAYGGISITPETNIMGDDYERPHKDIEWIIAGKDNLRALASECGLREKRSVLMRGAPLHLYTDPNTGLLVELRNINALPKEQDTGVYPYDKPLWIHPIMPRPLGLPVCAIYPTSIVSWGGETCQRICPEMTYLSKFTSDAEKDLYDAERLKRSGMLDYQRMRVIHDDTLHANMNIVVPPAIAHIIRRCDRNMGDDMHVEQNLAGTVWNANLK